MKTTKTMRFTVLALALCAFLAIPASAYAFGMPAIDTSGIQHQIDAAAAAAAQIEAAQPPAKKFEIVHRPDLELEVVGAADETTLGEPPAADDPAGDPAAPGHLEVTVEDEVPGADVPAAETTPGITVVVTQTADPDPDQPRFVREPDLPFTGGDAVPYLAGGALLALIGGAVILVKRQNSDAR